MVFLDEIGQKVNSLGYRVHILRGFGLNIKHISSLSQKLEDYIINNDLHDVILIGHSKGGLIGRYFIHKSNYSDRISQIIAIASPFHGSQFGNLRFWSLSELIPGNEGLPDDEALDSKILSIRARVDTLVFPNNSPILKYAENQVVDVVGHMRILHSQGLLEILDENLG